MTDSFDGSQSFLEDLEFDYQPTDTGIAGSFDVTSHALVPGTDQVRLSVLASVGDVVTGILVSSRTKPLVALTVDLSVRLLAPCGVGPLQMESRVAKQGRSISATEAWFRRDGVTVAHCWATFMGSPRPQDTLPGLPMQRARSTKTLPAPFADALGLRVIEPGVVDVDRRPYTLQPAGTIQGGVVCALAEVAAETRFGRPLQEIDVRYLSTIRIGPGRAEAELLTDELAQVTVTDAGRDDGRTASVAFARAPVAQ